MRISPEYLVKIEKELAELKSIVRDFIKETAHVPFRAIDCNQETVYTLWDKLTRAVGEENDRK